jgi:hypothetical protein
MHQQCLHDLDRDLDRRRLDVADRLLHHLVHHLSHLVNDMDLTMLVLHQYEVGNFLFQFRHLLVVLRLVVLQNLDEQNLDALLSFLDEVLPFPFQIDLVVVVVGVELRHRLKMDCYLDAVDEELRHRLKMDCYLDAEQPVQLALLLLQVLLQLLSLQPLLHHVQVSQHRVMLLKLQDRPRVRLRVLQLTLDLLRKSSLRQQSS